MATDQIWTLEHEGRQHRVEAGGGAAHVVRWYVDDELLAEKKTWDDKVRVEAPGDGGEKLLVRYSGLGKPRRATLVGKDEEVAALTGLGGVDLVPEPGSAGGGVRATGARPPDPLRPDRDRRAASRRSWSRSCSAWSRSGSRSACRSRTSRGPDLPDLPSVPWPSIPLPDLPDWQLPDWVRWLLDKAKYVWPVVLAYVLARAEIKRRREQDRRVPSRPPRRPSRTEPREPGAMLGE